MIADFCKRHNVKRVLFVPYAGVSLAEGGLKASYNAYEEKVKKVYAEFGVKLTSIHHAADPVKAVYQAECVPVLGDVLREAVVVSDLQSDTSYYKDF